MLPLVLADRHLLGLVEQDVGGLQDRVAEQPEARLAGAALGGLVLELRHPAQLAEPGQAAERPGQFGVLGHVALHEHRAPVGVQARGEQLGRGDPGPLPQPRRVLRHGDGVQVHHAVERVVGLLQGHPLAHRTQVVAEMEGVGGRLDAGERSWGWHAPQSRRRRVRARAAAGRVRTRGGLGQGTQMLPAARPPVRNWDQGWPGYQLEHVLGRLDRGQQAEGVGDRQRPGPVPHAQLAEQAGLHVLDGLRRDAERPRGLPDGMALGHGGQDVALPGGELGQPDRPGRVLVPPAPGRPRAAGASAWNPPPGIPGSPSAARQGSDRRSGPPRRARWPRWPARRRVPGSRTACCARVSPGCRGRRPGPSPASPDPPARPPAGPGASAPNARPPPAQVPA